MKACELTSLLVAGMGMGADGMGVQKSVCELWGNAALYGGTV